MLVLVTLGSLVGIYGWFVGRLIGAGIARWTRRTQRAARVASILLVVGGLGLGVQQASAVRTVPRSNADARAHDYSLAVLDQALILWVCVVNSVGAVVGIRSRVGKDEKRSNSAPSISSP